MKEEKMRLQSRNNESGGGAATMQTTTNANDDTDAMREQLEEQQRIAANKERLRKKLTAKSNGKEEIEEDDARLDPNAEKLPDGVDFSGEEHQGRYLDLVRFHHAFVADVARTFGVSYTEEVKKNASKKRKMEQRQKSGKKPSDEKTKRRRRRKATTKTKRRDVNRSNTSRFSTSCQTCSTLKKQPTSIDRRNSPKRTSLSAKSCANISSIF